MNEEEIKRIHKIIANRLKIYVENIKELYGKYMGEENLKRLEAITDYSECVFIEKYGAINAHATIRGVHFPLEAYEALEQLKKFDEYGSDKNHKLYTDDTIVLNDNTFFDYVNHVVVNASDVLDYYEDLLLHETMHFCGSGGASALKEGINEYLTRKTALKKGFRTSACGYPKEVKIVYELEKIFKEDFINKIAFINDDREMLNFIEKEKGYKARKLFENIMKETEKEFYDKYYCNMHRYVGLNGIKQKVIDYDKIDYSKIYKLIDVFSKQKHM